MQFLVADVHSIVRMGLKLMLEADYPDLLTDEAENGIEILERMQEKQYDLLILDFQMPNTDTFTLIANLLVIDRFLKILIYSMASPEIISAKLFDSGVKGFLSKDASSTELLKAVDIILQGGRYFR